MVRLGRPLARLCRREPLPRAASRGAGRCQPAPRPFSGLASSVHLARDSLLINWRDGAADELNPVWLRERCQSHETVDLATKQPRKSPHDLPKELHLDGASLLEGPPDLQVHFSDGHVSEFSLARLRAELRHFQDTPIQVPQYKKLFPRVWSGSGARMPEFAHGAVVREERARLALVEELLTGGQALVRDVPQEDGEVVRFGQTLSTLRATDWGASFNVRTKPDVVSGGSQKEAKMDLAYTPHPIGFHTDNPHRYPTPDFQLLHAIEHCSCPDGEAPCPECQVMNYMVDGFYIAELLRREDPEAFRLLCEVPVRFENNGGDNGSALVNVAPHLELEDALGGAEPRPRAVRFSAKSGQYAPPLSSERLSAFYRARRRFSELAHDAKHILSLQFRPGDLLVFDNQRILHARSRIAPTDGERWVQGCYIDRDGLWLNFERWRRRANAR